MDPRQVYWNSPAGVRLGYHDGREELTLFSTRIEAEQWVHMLPLLQMNQQYEDVASATLMDTTVGLN